MLRSPPPLSSRPPRQSDVVGIAGQMRDAFELHGGACLGKSPPKNAHGSRASLRRQSRVFASSIVNRNLRWLSQLPPLPPIDQGLPVDEHIVKEATKQRTLARKV